MVNLKSDIESSTQSLEDLNSQSEDYSDKIDRNNRNKMQIGILDVSGEVTKLWIKKENTVLELKERLSSLLALHLQEQRIIFRGRILKDYETMDDAKVEDGTVLHLFKRLKNDVSTDVSNRSQHPTQTRNTTSTYLSRELERDFSSNFESEQSRQEMRLLATCLFLVSALQFMDSFAYITGSTFVKDSSYAKSDICDSFNAALWDFIQSASGLLIGVIGYKATYGSQIVLLRLYQFGIIATAFFSIGLRANLLRNFMTGKLDGCECDDLDPGQSDATSGSIDHSSNLAVPSIGLERCDNDDAVFKQNGNLLFVMVGQLLLPTLVWIWCIFRAHRYSNDLINVSRANSVMRNETQSLNNAERQNYNAMMTV